MNDPTVHTAEGDSQRCLCTINRAGRPNAGLSTNSTGSASLNLPGLRSARAVHALGVCFEAGCDNKE